MVGNVKGNDHLKYVEFANVLLSETYRLAHSLQKARQITSGNVAGTMGVILTPDIHKVNDHVQCNSQLIAVLISRRHTQVLLEDHSHQHVDKYKEVNHDEADPEEPR